MELPKRIFIKLIIVYQKVLSPDQGYLRFILPNSGICAMYPSCSHYMIGSVEKYGVCKGAFRGVRRILRCHPYQKNLIDPP